jgi:deoxyribodipyrimidine photo-lyase
VAGPSVVLFTRDLRVHDHAALAEAARTSAHVVPLFVLDESLVGGGAAPNRLAFLVEALEDLRQSLRARGADLVVRRGDPVVETMRVATAVAARAVFVGADASAYARRRAQRLGRACDRARIELRVANTVAAVPPGELAPEGHDHYRVFTPYWRRWRAVQPPSLAAVPTRLALPPAIEAGRIPALAELTPQAPSPSLAVGGEREGRRRLERWLAHGERRYADERNGLASEQTSRLSPYLHFGCVSPREVVARALRGGAAADAFVRQLCWRDFYLQLLAANPSLPTDDLHPRGDDWADDAEALARWRAGRTGYPIVDAGMRQLHAEGWMHNRARLVVASFLTKTLYLDWRLGAAVFFELLVDGDVANNVGNWQWVAGTGVDMRPNRHFNPIAQAKRLDPDGVYVRRHVPELAPLDGPGVHEPWRSPLARVAPDYPPPMVDHAEANRRFRERRSRRRATRV